MALSEHQVMQALWPVTDPELHVSIVELDMVRRIDIRRGRVTVTVALTVPGCPLRGGDHPPGHLRPRSRCRESGRQRRSHRHDAPGAGGRPGPDGGPAGATATTPQDLPAWGRRRPRAPARPSHGAGVGPRPSVTRPAGPILSDRRARPASSGSPPARAGWGNRRSPSTWRCRWPRPDTTSPSSTPTCTGSRSPACSGSTPSPTVNDMKMVPPVVLRRALHVDGILRRRRPAGHLAGSDAAQGAGTVPGRRRLGRTRVPADRHAARNGRRRPVDGAVPADVRGLRRDHPAAGGPAGRPAQRLHGEEDPPAAPRRHREHELADRRGRRAASTCSAKGAAPSWPASSGYPCSARSLCRRPCGSGVTRAAPSSWPNRTPRRRGRSRPSPTAGGPRPGPHLPSGADDSLI